jgi:D-tyrosyl-tRNA(Tyr) deacylase
MKAVVQRVSQAETVIGGVSYSAIGKGLLILLGIEKGDTIDDARYLVRKIASLRIFEDNQGKMNLSLKDVQGQALIVSQFTLFADCAKGNRPSFTQAETPQKAIRLYQEFIELVKQEEIFVATGVFGATMQISLVNEGPVTIIIESPKR